jgi:pepF/M3 family oligoendopeptidase
LCGPAASPRSQAEFNVNQVGLFDHNTRSRFVPSLAPPAAASALPRWDVSDVFPGLDSPEFAAAFDRVDEAIRSIAELFDREGIGARESAPLGDATVRVFDEVTDRLNAVLTRMETLGAYVGAFVTTDSRNALAQARRSELEQLGVRLRQRATRYVAWIGSLDVHGLIERSETARAHAFPLAQMQVAARHQMSPAEEELAAALYPSGGGAWARLHGNVTSQIEVEVEIDGGQRTLPMSAVRNLAHEPDRELRRRAHEAELVAWERWAVPIAAAMNGVKGEVLTLAERRGWASPLAEALFAARIDEATLRTMLEAAEASFPDFRRYLRAKARALGLDRLAWYDLAAPVGATTSEERWSWENATGFVLDRFGDYSDRLRGLAERAFDERWIDAEPRPGKRDGAFCMRIRDGESRILANYQPSYDGVSTIAHELGHAYHNLNFVGLPPLQRENPMTLAETASTFCETIVKEAALEVAGDEERLGILEASLHGACGTIVDITSRFRFEERLFARRRQRELSVDELNELMLQAQHETYGDGLDGEALHAYMWAVKPHYYSTGRSFYNFPYMFGLLFGLGLYARYREAPDDFRARYDDLLAHTGRADAATLAARFGIDVRRAAFWEGSLAMISSDVDRFESLVAATATSG